MQCASKIEMQGSPPGKLKADFDGDDRPKFVRVLNSTPLDENHVSTSGNWKSRNNTYTSKQQVLELLAVAGGPAVNTCSYGSNGILIINPCTTGACSAVYQMPGTLQFIETGSGVITVSLSLMTEPGSECDVKEYLLQKKVAGGIGFDTVGTLPYSMGAKGLYDFLNIPAGNGDTFFAIAKFNNAGCADKPSDPYTYIS